MNQSENFLNKSKNQNIKEHSENIYKSHTLNPQADKVASEYCLTNLKHKKVMSHNTEGYRQHIKQLIIEILRTNNFGIPIETLKEKIKMSLGYEIQNKLLEVNSFKEFILKHLHKCVNIRVVLMNRRGNGPQDQLIVYPKYWMPGSQPSPNWNFPPMLYGEFNRTGQNTPSTCSKSQKMTPNMFHQYKTMIRTTPSLNPHNRKDHSVSPNIDTSFQMMVPRGETENQHMSGISYLSGISKVENTENLSIASLGFNCEYFAGCKPEEPPQIRDKEEDQEDNKGFTYRVLNLNSDCEEWRPSQGSIQIHTKRKSCFSSEDDSKPFILEEELDQYPEEEHPVHQLLICKKLTSGAESSCKKHTKNNELPNSRESNLLKYLGI